MILAKSINRAVDALKPRAARMNSRSMKRKTCTGCYVSKFCSDECVRASLSVCVSVHARARVHGCLFCSQDCFLPSLKWVVGAFQHLSITERDEDDEEEEEEEGCFISSPPPPTPTRQEGTAAVLAQRQSHDATPSDT